MRPLLIANWVLFLGVTAYALALFTYLIKTRTQFIKLGRKEEFEHNIKERLRKIWVYVFGQKKLLKDKKSGIIHVMFFYGFILVQFGAIDLIWKGLKPGSHLPFGPVYGAFTFFQEIVVFMILVAVVWAFHRRYIEKLVRLETRLEIWTRSYFHRWINAFDITCKWYEYDLAWHEHDLDRTSRFVNRYYFWIHATTAASVVFFVGWWIHLLILLTFLSLCAAIKTCALNRRTCQYVFPPS